VPTKTDPNMLSDAELKQIRTWLKPGPLLPEIRDDMAALFVHVDAQAAEIDRLNARLALPASGDAPQTQRGEG
jgi:hypothetical protein